MLFHKLTIALAGLVSLTVAIPTSITQGTVTDTITDVESPTNATAPLTFIANLTAGPEDKCGKSTFENWTDDGNDGPAALISDCLILNKNIADGGYWTIESVIHHKHTIATYGTCAFRVQAVTPYQNSLFYIGNTDIIDVINDAIQVMGQFDKGVIVGSGQMHCQGGLTGSYMRWELVWNHT